MKPTAFVECWREWADSERPRQRLPLPVPRHLLAHEKPQFVRVGYVPTAIVVKL